MRHKLSVKNPIGNFSHLALQSKFQRSSANFQHKSASNSKMSTLDNRFERQNLLANQHKRVSFLTGKKMPHYPSTKRSKQYRRLQMTIYNFLERPSGPCAISYQIIIFSTVFLCLVLSVLATIPQYETAASNILMYTEMVIVVWLSVELTLRVWSAGCRSRYQTWRGRLKFMKNVFCILDLTVIVASISLTILASSQNRHKNFAAAAFRGLRFFQILRMLRVDRRAGTWRLLGTVVWAHRQELITTFYIGFLSLIVSSFIMYLLEKDAEDTKINTFADSLWWGVITLCTIGYGDVYPVTWMGKLLASSCALIGISFFALPAGILGSGFALKVQAMQRQKHLNRRRAPAATLIQSIWRCYAADQCSLSTATWKIHIKALSNPQNVNPSGLPSNLQNTDFSIAQLAKPYVAGNSILNRMTSLKKRNVSDDPLNKSYLKPNHLTQLQQQPGAPLSGYMTSKRRDAIVLPSLFNANTSIYGENSNPTNYNHLNNPQIVLSDTTLDEVPDSPTNFEQIDLNEFSNSTNRSNSSFAIALATLSRSQQQQQDPNKIIPVKSSFAHRTLNFLSELNSNNLLKPEVDTGEDGLFQIKNKPQLTLQQKNAVRIIRKIKYFVARRKFREALRPYDVTDVIEQYSAGNLDMLARIKTLQFRLDKILGSSKAKDCYDSNTISLASRIVKVERQMDDIELKFDKFISCYTVDMKILIEKLNYSLPNAITNSKHQKSMNQINHEQLFKTSNESAIQNRNKWKTLNSRHLDYTNSQLCNEFGELDHENDFYDAHGNLIDKETLIDSTPQSTITNQELDAINAEKTTMKNSFIKNNKIKLKKHLVNKNFLKKNLVNAIQSNSEYEINLLAKHKSDSDLCSNKTTIHKLATSPTTSTTTTTTTKNNEEASNNHTDEAKRDESKHATNLLESNSKSENLTRYFTNDFKIDAGFASILLDNKMKKEKALADEKNPSELSGKIEQEQFDRNDEKENNEVVKKKVVICDAEIDEENGVCHDLNDTHHQLSLSSHSLQLSDNFTKTPKNESHLSLNNTKF